jgi:hypothetical protein
MPRTDGATDKAACSKIDKNELNLIASCIIHDIKKGKRTVEDLAKTIRLKAPLTKHADMSCVTLHVVSCEDPYTDEKLPHPQVKSSSIEISTLLRLTNKYYYGI